MDDSDRTAWVQDTLDVDPESYATQGPAPVAATAGDAPETRPADTPQPDTAADPGTPAVQPVSQTSPGAGSDGPDDPVPLQSKGGADAGADAGADELPTMNPTSPVPTDITADSAVDFVKKANDARGGGGEVGHMAPNITFSPDTDASGKITRVNMTVETSIVRPRYAGGRPNDVNRAAIKKAEELIKAHEERHRDIARDYATRALKAMRGKNGADAQKAFDAQMKQMDKAQVDLDKKEGAISAKESNGGATVDVSLGPAP